MMKLWLVVYIFNEVAMSVGPLPYDRITCDVRRLVKQEEVDAIFRGDGKLPERYVDAIFRGYDGKLPERDALGREVTRGDFRIACIESEERPRGNDHGN